MDRRTSEQIRDLLEVSNKIGIAVGKNSGIDELAGALALYLALLERGKNVSIACPTDPLVEHTVLVGIDRVKKNFDGATGDMVVSFPYKEGDIEKISYTLENGLLNIIVKGGEEGLSFNENDVIFKRSEGNPELLFVVGTSKLSDLDKIFDPHALRDTKVINIDNKRDNQGFGDIVLVSSNFSSVSEGITDLLILLDISIDIDIAQNLLLGIENATNNFQGPNTSPVAFEMAAALMKKGARRTGTSFRRQQSVPLEEVSSIFSPKDSNILSPIDKDEKRNSSLDKQATKDLSAARLPGQGRPASQRGEQRKNPPVDWLTPKIYKGSTNI